MDYQNRTEQSDSYAEYFLTQCGYSVMEIGATGYHLTKPKCTGRVLRMLAMYQGAITLMQLGMMPLSVYESCHGILLRQKSEYDKRHAYKGLPPVGNGYVEACNAAISIFESRNDIELFELHLANKLIISAIGQMAQSEILRLIADVGPFRNVASRPRSD